MHTEAPPVPRGRTHSGWSSAWRRARDTVASSSIYARLTAGAVLASLGVTAWWLSQDTRITDFYSAIQTHFAFIAHDDVARGDVFKPLTEWDNYPPLARIVGSLGVFVGGHSNHAVLLALNLVFVPALAIGCYGAGRMISGNRAGLLAAVFALGIPMIVSESHEVYPDPLQASLVALSVFAILASRHFERPGIAASAGVLSGLAMLAKETTPIFLGGLLLVALARGGWRNRRGVAAYFAALIVVGAPWYLVQAGRLNRLVGTTVKPPPGLAAAVHITTPSHFSFENLSWYFWDAANQQLRLPLLALLIVGTVAALRSSIVDRRPDNYYPELLAGALVSYVGITFITIKDPRYTLPALVYMAVLATAWIPRLRFSLRSLLTSVLVASVLVSFISVAFGVGGPGYRVRIALPGAHPERQPGQRFITVYATLGWVRGVAETEDGNVLAIMHGLHGAGVRAVTSCCGLEHPEEGVDGGAEREDFNTVGLLVMASEAGLRYVAQQSELGPSDVFLALHAPIPGAPPCQRLADGTGIYAILGNPIGRPFSRYTFICPGHRPQVYGYAPQSVSLAHAS
jgi:Dolichyl-phosphate-mannose-protein mannosyltransferase